MSRAGAGGGCRGRVVVAAAASAATVAKVSHLPVYRPDRRSGPLPVPRICLPFAFVSLPTGVQLMLAREGDDELQRALAVSPFTADSVLDTLAETAAPHARRLALRRTTRGDLVNRSLSADAFPSGAAYAARNPLADPQLLAAGLRSTDRAVALSCYLNPRTPQRARRRITPRDATRVTDVGGSLADRVVRANELVLANPFMAHAAGRWDGTVRRALAGLPALTAEQAAQLRGAGRAGLATLARHPVQSGFDTTGDLAACVAEASPALDMQLVDGANLDLSTALMLLQRRPVPEPHVIARLVRRLGPSFLAAVTAADLAVSRITAATWAEPMIEFRHHALVALAASTAKVPAVLGDDEQLWRTYFTLLQDWHGDHAELAESARKL